jgi:hypothetical protein
MSVSNPDDDHSPKPVTVRSVQGSASQLKEHMVDIRDMRFFIDRKSWFNSIKLKARIESPCYRFLSISISHNTRAGLSTCEQ